MKSVGLGQRALYLSASQIDYTLSKTYIFTRQKTTEHH
jgi:hypothetical protein